MPNIAEIASRLHILEEKMEKLTPSLNPFPEAIDIGSAVSGIPTALGIQLMGLTNAQRTTLGVKLSGLSTVIHLFIYDKEDQAFYTWSGTEWV